MSMCQPGFLKLALLKTKSEFCIFSRYFCSSLSAPAFSAKFLAFCSSSASILITSSLVIFLRSAGSNPFKIALSISAGILSREKGFAIFLALFSCILFSALIHSFLHLAYICRKVFQILRLLVYRLQFLCPLNYPSDI